MKIVSWNINGIRAAKKKGLFDFMEKSQADAYLFQEIKIGAEDINNELRNFPHYNSFWYPALRKGYSGVAIYSRKHPEKVIKGIGDQRIDKEGRVLTLEFPHYFLINVYFPNSQRMLERLKFKLLFNQLFAEYCRDLSKKKPLIIGGDFNVAHQEIDIARPKQNQNHAGFTKEERGWFGAFLEQGHLDTFRQFISEGGYYTYWTYLYGARKKNIGWRIDYFLISQQLKKKLKKASILDTIEGSDHCPIGIDINLSPVVFRQ